MLRRHGADADAAVRRGAGGGGAAVQNADPAAVRRNGKRAALCAALPRRHGDRAAIHAVHQRQQRADPRGPQPDLFHAVHDLRRGAERVSGLAVPVPLRVGHPRRGRRDGDRAVRLLRHVRMLFPALPHVSDPAGVPAAALSLCPADHEARRDQSAQPHGDDAGQHRDEQHAHALRRPVRLRQRHSACGVRRHCEAEPDPDRVLRRPRAGLPAHLELQHGRAEL